MFGDNRQYKKLVAKGKKAPAEVTAATQGHMTTVTQDESSLCQDSTFGGVLSATVRPAIDRRGCIELAWVRE
jgi:hypothetical protein